jgi:hypothetical protein
MLPIAKFDPRAPLGEISASPLGALLPPVHATPPGASAPVAFPGVVDATVPLELLGRVVLLATDGSPAAGVS